MTDETALITLALFVALGLALWNIVEVGLKEERDKWPPDPPAPEE